VYEEYKAEDKEKEEDEGRRRRENEERRKEKMRRRWRRTRFHRNIFTQEIAKLSLSNKTDSH